MTKKIFKSIDPDFIRSHFTKNKDNFFSDKKREKIKDIKIKQVSPSWAKKTCLARYRLLFSSESEKIVRGTSKADSPKKDIWTMMNHLYDENINNKKLGTPRPLDYIKDINLLLYEEAPGKPLISVLEKGTHKEKKDSFKKAGTWLSWIHSLDFTKKRIPDATFIGSRGYKKTLTKVEENIPELKKYLPLKKEMDLMDKIWKHKKTFIHNDFYPGNSVVGEKIFFGIDFDRSGFGPPLMDVAALYSFFDFSKRMWPHKLNEKESGELRKIFLREYCLNSKISLNEIVEKIHPFLIKSFLDQLHYYVGFYIKGRSFMDDKTKKAFSLIIKDILIKIKKLKNEK